MELREANSRCWEGACLKYASEPCEYKYKFMYKDE